MRWPMPPSRWRSHSGPGATARSCSTCGDVSAYTWSSAEAAVAVAAVLFLLVLVARALDFAPKRIALRCAWSLLPLAIAVLAWLLRREPAGIRMLGFVAGTFVAMKAIVLQ